MMHLNNSIRYKRSFVNINPQSNTDLLKVTCTVHFYYTSNSSHTQETKKKLSVFHSSFLMSIFSLPHLLTRFKFRRNACFVNQKRNKKRSNFFLLKKNLWTAEILINHRNNISSGWKWDKKVKEQTLRITNRLFCA